MKKTLMVLMVLFTLLLIPNIKANALSDSFYVAEYLPNEYIVKINSTSGKYEQMRTFRRKSDGRVAYCLELWEGINENKTLTGYDNNQYDYGNIPYYAWEKIMLISYYGYGYQNHTDKKWIAITQFMIWKILSPESTLYFTDTLNGNQITKYETEMNEINELVRLHPTLPSFNTQLFDVRYKEDYQIIDENGVLEDYDITSYSTIKADKSYNTLTVNTNMPSSRVTFAKRGKLYDSNPIVYVDPNGQDLLIAGNFYPVYAYVDFNLPLSTITVTKLDEDTNSQNPQGDASLIGTTFQLLDKDQQLVSTKTLSNNNELTFENIGYGTYYLKETESGTGYLLNKNILKLEINSANKYINFYNEVIKEKIILHKYLKNPITNEIKPEKDATFSIYNLNNEKIHTITTDDNGTVELTLPYGNYILKQETGAINHKFIEDLAITVNTNGNIQEINLYNEELTSLVKIINTDNISNLPLLESGAKFEVKNLDTNIKTLITNDNGETAPILLSSGKYTIKQLSSISNYKVNNNEFIFEINEASIINNNSENIMEIIVPNEKLKSNIEIIKKTEYYLDDILINTEVDDNYNLNIYAKEDIYSKDKIKLYDKDQIVSKDFYFGNYYIINPIDQVIVDIIIDSINTRKIELLEKKYEYTPILEPNEDKSEDLEEDEFINDSFEVITDVPNTYQKQTYLYFDTFLIVFGLILNKREKHNENK